MVFDIKSSKMLSPFRKKGRCPIGCVIALVVAGVVAKVEAQLPNHPPSSISPELVSAVAGEPFGVASLAIPIGIVEKGRLPRIIVSDTADRVFYPAVSLEELPPPSPATPANARPILRGGLVDRLRHAINNAGQQVHPPSLLRVQFLFRSDGPLQVKLAGDRNETVAVIPNRADPELHRRTLESWWSGYAKQSEQQFSGGDYPPGIEAYLTAMLSSRLGLPEVDLRPKKQREKKKDDPLSSIELLAGTDAMRSEILLSSLERPPLNQAGSRVDVPLAPHWHTVDIPPTGADVTVESMATAVPPECFYMRFGSFGNAMWFQDINKGKGDGLAQMIMRRGLDAQANQRLERMLNTKTSVLAKLFGDSLIKDMAVIGLDFYLQEGPAIGIVFEAANPELLRTAMNTDRESTAKQRSADGARLETLQIAGNDVSFLSTPNNSIRSFLVQRDRFLFVTSSRHLVTRFLEVADGQPSLAVQPVFRHIRTVMPTSNDYSIFAFFSPEFFQNLLSPQYQIELRRRLAAIARVQVADMASMCAASEGLPKQSLRDLIDNKLLPPWFSASDEDSQPIRQGELRLDSRRGGRGHFLPIPDCPVVDCSPAEAERYVELADFYSKSWKHTDPLVVGLRRFADPNDPNVEQVGVEAFVAPFGSEKFGWLSLFLAPPVRTQIQLPADDMVNLQAHLSGKSLLSRTPTPDHVMFLGVKDMQPPPPEDERRLLETLRMLQQTPAYLGAWPLPGYLDRLPFGLGGGPPDALGFSKLLIGAWRWQAGGFSVLSFDRSILENCMLHLRPVPAEDPAQIRGRIADLENSKLSSWINTFWYRRALHASRGNALLMDTIQTQFHIPANQSKSVAELLLDGRLQCSLGGEYQVDEATNLWMSTMWRSDGSPDAVGSTNIMGLNENPHQAFPPADYRAPWLGWFRGGAVHLTQLPTNLVLIAKLRLQKLPPPPDNSEAVEPTPALPSLNFDLFTAPFKFFNKDEPKEANEPNGTNNQSKDRREF